MIVFDASAVVSAALKADSIPGRALLRAEEIDVFALSIEVDREIEIVLNRRKFAQAIPLERRAMILDVLRRTALWFDPAVRITECRDPKDDKYLELAVASGAETICKRRRRPPGAGPLARDPNLQSHELSRRN